MAVKGSETRCDHQCFTTAVFVFPCFLNTVYKHVCVSLASTPANFHCSGFCLNADPVPLNPFGVSPRQGTASCPRSHLRSHVHLAFLPVRRHVFVYAEEPWGQKRCNLRIGLRYEGKQDYYAWECVQGSWKGKTWIAEKSVSLSRPMYHAMRTHMCRLLRGLEPVRIMCLSVFSSQNQPNKIYMSRRLLR